MWPSARVTHHHLLPPQLKQLPTCRANVPDDNISKHQESILTPQSRISPGSGAVQGRQQTRVLAIVRCSAVLLGLEICQLSLHGVHALHQALEAGVHVLQRLRTPRSSMQIPLQGGRVPEGPRQKYAKGAIDLFFAPMPYPSPLWGAGRWG